VTQNAVAQNGRGIRQDSAPQDFDIWDRS